MEGYHPSTPCCNPSSIIALLYLECKRSMTCPVQQRDPVQVHTYLLTPTYTVCLYLACLTSLKWNPERRIPSIHTLDPLSCSPHFDVGSKKQLATRYQYLELEWPVVLTCQALLVHTHLLMLTLNRGNSRGMSDKYGVVSSWADPIHPHLVTPHL